MGIDHNFISAYREGFIDGAKAKECLDFTILGYRLDEILKMIEEKEMKKAQEQQSNEADAESSIFDMTNVVKRQLAARQKRQEFRAALAKAGFSTSNYLLLDVYDSVHVPELNNPLHAIQQLMIETKKNKGPASNLEVGYPTAYGASCLIDGLKNKGWEIKRINYEE